VPEQGAEPHETPKSSATAQDLASSVAKWFIPSASALFLVTGYIVQVSEESLLGIGGIAHTSNSYVESSAQFVRDILSLPIEILFNRPLSLFANWLSLGITVAAATSLLVSFRWRKISSTWSHRTAPVVIVLLLGAKFLAFDAPLSLVGNIILGNAAISGLVDKNLTGPEKTDAINDKIQTNVKWPLSDMISRASHFATVITCSHLGATTLVTAGYGGQCDSDSASRAAAPRAIFTVLVLMQIVVIIASVLILRSTRLSARRAILALIGLTYVATVPYDYGKLLRSTSFDYGIVRLSTPLLPNVGVDSDLDGTIVRGLILSHDGSETRLLYVHNSGNPCGANYQKQIQMLSLVGSEVVSTAQIESHDIFEWSFASKPKCD